MRIRSVLLITLAALIGIPNSSAAAARLPTLGAVDGATVTLSDGHVEFRLAGAAAAAAARYVGRTLDVECSTHPRPGLLFTSGGGTSESGTEAPVVREGDGTLVLRPQGKIATDATFDVCALSRPDGGRHVLARHGNITVTTLGKRAPLARAAVTPAGAVWLDELGHVSQIYDVVWATRVHGDYPVPAALAARQPGLVALDSSAASPPAGQVGYWSDGAGRATLVTLSGTGRRLVLEDEGDGMLRSNVDDFGSSYVPPGPQTEVDLFNAEADRDRRGWKPGKPVDARDGVRASVADHRLAVRFGGRAAAAYRRIAGRRVVVICSGPVAVGLFNATSALEAFHSVTVRVPRRGETVRARIAGAADLCVINDDGHNITTVTPTATGRGIVADFEASASLFGASDNAGAAAGSTAYRSAAELARRLGHGAVALSGPDAPVARGHIGVWTDGAQRMVLAATSSTGRRMVWADDGDGISRSNAFSSVAAAILLISFE